MEHAEIDLEIDVIKINAETVSVELTEHLEKQEYSGSCDDAYFLISSDTEQWRRGHSSLLKGSFGI